MKEHGVPRSQSPRGQSPRRYRGIALMMTLVVVMLLTAYISEFFFTSGLELRAMQTFKDGARARTLAQLAFKATQVGLLMDEVEFFTQFAELRKALLVTSIPWEDGFLVALEIIPRDHLFNLNELAKVRDDTPKDRTRWNLFLNILKEVDTLPIEEGLEPQPLPQERLAELYAALVDWLDTNNTDYQGTSNALGAEQDAYFDVEPEFQPKNGQLDRLSEIRLVKGMEESRFPWKIWEEKFSVLPITGGLYPEKLNVNIATREEIVEFLEERLFEGADRLGADQDQQNRFNAYADNAAEIAKLIAPEEELRTRFDQKSLTDALKTIPDLEGFRNSGKDFAFATQYYRVKLTMNVNEVDARLMALVRVVRTPVGIGQQVEVLRLVLQ